MPENYNSSGSDLKQKNNQKIQRLLFLLFACLGVFLIYLSADQLKSRMNAPFNFVSTNVSELSAGERQMLLMHVLQNTDTDGDGLSDYDEIYIYGTSPYLADTDGDGISDYDEIMQGTDPLCPEGQDCYGLMDPNYIVDTGTIGLPDQDQIEEDGETTIIEQIVSGEADPVQLRALLLDNGFNADDLELISDEELIEIYYEIIMEQFVSQQQLINNQ